MMTTRPRGTITRRSDAEVITLQRTAGVRLLRNREGGPWSTDPKAVVEDAWFTILRDMGDAAAECLAGT